MPCNKANPTTDHEYSSLEKGLRPTDEKPKQSKGSLQQTLLNDAPCPKQPRRPLATTRLLVIRGITTKTWYWLCYVLMLLDLLMLFAFQLFPNALNKSDTRVAKALAITHFAFVLFSANQAVSLV